MRIICAIGLLLCCSGYLVAQDSLNSITELQHLLQERRDRFESYASAADKRSGIFGMKTKKDMEESREILLGIVNLDNRIMAELTHVISARGMAKANYSTDLMENSEMIKRLTAASDTLYKQLTVQKEMNESLQAKTERQKWVLYFFIAATGILLLSLLSSLVRKRKMSNVT